MDRLEAMTILTAAADTGSLSAASRHLRIPLATVSRRVSELEAHLNIRLLHRGNRELVLTDAGRSYVASCRRILEEIAEVERAASGEYLAPQGQLIITAPPVLGRTHLLPIVVEFLRAFRDVRVRLLLTDRYVNLVEEHVDLAVRIRTGGQQHDRNASWINSLCPVCQSRLLEEAWHAKTACRSRGARLCDPRRSSNSAELEVLYRGDYANDPGPVAPCGEPG
jgi:DNA-binding transcriptional LysR family regulator